LKTAFITGQEEARREQMTEADHTANLEAQILAGIDARKAAREMAMMVANTAQQAEALRAKQAAAEAQKAAEALLLEIDRAKRDLDALYAEAASERRIREETAIADAMKTRMEAVAPGFIEALQSLALTGQFEAMGQLVPLSVVEGKSLSGTMDTLFKGTPLEHLVDNLKRVSVKA
jgi:hypothetical protein